MSFLSTAQIEYLRKLGLEIEKYNNVDLISKDLDIDNKSLYIDDLSIIVDKNVVIYETTIINKKSIIVYGILFIENDDNKNYYLITKLFSIKDILNILPKSIFNKHKQIDDCLTVVEETSNLIKINYSSISISIVSNINNDMIVNSIVKLILWYLKYYII